MPASGAGGSRAGRGAQLTGLDRRTWRAPSPAASTSSGRPAPNQAGLVCGAARCECCAAVRPGRAGKRRAHIISSACKWIAAQARPAPSAAAAARGCGPTVTLTWRLGDLAVQHAASKQSGAQGTQGASTQRGKAKHACKGMPIKAGAYLRRHTRTSTGNAARARQGRRQVTTRRLAQPAGSTVRAAGRKFPSLRALRVSKRARSRAQPLAP